MMFWLQEPSGHSDECPVVNLFELFLLFWIRNTWEVVIIFVFSESFQKVGPIFFIGLFVNLNPLDHLFVLELVNFFLSPKSRKVGQVDDTEGDGPGGLFTLESFMEGPDN